MIIDTLESAGRHTGLHPLFAAAFDFLKRPETRELPVGRHEVMGDRVFALVSHAPHAVAFAVAGAVAADGASPGRPCP